MSKLCKTFHYSPTTIPVRLALHVFWLHILCPLNAMHDYTYVSLNMFPKPKTSIAVCAEFYLHIANDDSRCCIPLKLILYCIFNVFTGELLLSA